MVVLPKAKKDEGSVAMKLQSNMKEEIEKVFMEFPMCKIFRRRKEARKRNAMLVQELLEQRKNVGF